MGANKGEQQDKQQGDGWEGKKNHKKMLTVTSTMAI
jgi:hypothetical protein